METKIKDRIKQLKTERDEFIKQIEQQFAYFNGAIETLENLLNPLGEEKDGDTNDNQPGIS